MTESEDEQQLKQEQPPDPPPEVIPPPFPWVAMMTVALALLVHGLALTSLFSYIGYMVIHIGATTDKDKSGYYAGYITGSFMLGRVFTSFYWGSFSDHHGRKIVLLIGIGCVGVLSIAFGLCTSFWQAVGIRFLLGAFNAIVGTGKTAITEICGAHHEVQGMGFVLGTWSLSFVIGPALGGVLADPCTQYPGYFSKNGLFATYPYLLPNIPIAAIAFFVFFAVIYWIPETSALALTRREDARRKSHGNNFLPLSTTDTDSILPTNHESHSSPIRGLRKSKPRERRGKTENGIELQMRKINQKGENGVDVSSTHLPPQHRVIKSHDSDRSGWELEDYDRGDEGSQHIDIDILDGEKDFRDNSGAVMREERDMLVHRHTHTNSGSKYVDIDILDPDDRDVLVNRHTQHAHTHTHNNDVRSNGHIHARSPERSPERSVEHSREHSPEHSFPKGTPKARGTSPVIRLGRNGAHLHEKDDMICSGNKGTAKIKGKSDLRRMVSVPVVRSVLLVYFLQSLLSIMFDEVYPLWALATSASGGLDYNPHQIGSILTLAGICMTVSQVLLYPPVAKAMGYVRMLKMACFVMTPLYFAVPLCSLLRGHATWLDVALIGALTALKTCNNMIFSSIALITNNSVDADLRGGLNGLTMAVGSVSKALGPPLGSSMFAYSISSGHVGAVMNYYFTFNVLVAGSLLLSFLCLYIFPNKIVSSNGYNTSDTNNTTSDSHPLMQDMPITPKVSVSTA